jgi:hypothetical protein
VKFDEAVGAVKRTARKSQVAFNKYHTVSKASAFLSRRVVVVCGSKMAKIIKKSKVSQKRRGATRGGVRNKVYCV